MGAGASSLMRLRKTLVIRAYNTRKGDETLEERFRKYAYKRENITYISLEDIKQSLALNAPWVDDLFHRCIGDTVAELEFQEFLLFMETGKPPFKTSSSYGSNLSHSRSTCDVKSGQLEKRSTVGSDVNLQQHHNKAGDLSSPQSSTVHWKIAQDDPEPVPQTNVPNCVTLKPGSDEACNFEVDNQQLPRTTRPETIEVFPDPDAFANVEYSVIEVSDDEEDERKTPHGYLDASPTTTVAVRARPGQLSNGPTKPLWRKREVVRQERTVHYTTVDAEGVLQELIEKETTQTEVLHMECRETGEFAHRETSLYEQTELFNDEVVAEERGTEEYVHLKSLEDEFEYMNTTMPKKTAAEPEVPGGVGEEKGTGTGSPFRESRGSPSAHAQAFEAQSPGMEGKRRTGSGSPSGHGDRGDDDAHSRAYGESPSGSSPRRRRTPGSPKSPEGGRASPAGFQSQKYGGFYEDGGTYSNEQGPQGGPGRLYRRPHVPFSDSTDSALPGDVNDDVDNGMQPDSPVLEEDRWRVNDINYHTVAPIAVSDSAPVLELPLNIRAGNRTSQVDQEAEPLSNFADID